MIQLVHRILIISLISASFGVIQAQTEQQIPLYEVLLEVEERYKIKFSFENSTIENIRIGRIKSDFSREEALEWLEKTTGLRFQVLSKRFIAISKPGEDSIYDQIQQLDEVVVQNYLTKGLSKTITGTVDINTSSFNIFPGLIEPDILQIAQKLPGIISVDERISNINVRGGTNDQNLMLYEGIRMYQSGHFFGLISAFNPYLTETVDISKNGTSVRYGDGVSGLFSIKTSDELSNTTNVGLGLNMLSVDGFSKVTLSKKAELQISARRSYTDFFTSMTFNSYFDRIFRDSELNAINNADSQLAVDDNFLFYDLNAKLLYDIDSKTKLRITAINLYNDLDYNQIFSLDTNETVEQNSNLSQISFGIGATLSKTWDNGLETSLQTYYSNYDLDADNIINDGEQRLVQENEIEDYGLRLDVKTPLRPNLKLVGGYQYNEVGVSNLEDVTNPDFRSFIKEVIRTHSIFSELEWFSRSKQTFLRIGARSSYFEKLSKFVVEPRFVMNQKLNEALRIELIGELKSQSLTQIIDLQQDFFGIEKRRWQLANEADVPVIGSQQVSLGLSYNTSGWLISAEAYYKNVDDITARSQGFQNQFQFQNDIGSFTVTGIDFLINKRFKNFSTWLSYTYSTNDYRFNTLNGGEEFANTLDLRHVANLSLTYKNKGLQLGFGVNWHSGRAFTAPAELQDNNSTTIAYKAPNSSRLPDYFRTDISALYKFKLQGINAEVGASVWNIFDRTNILNRFYTLEADNTIVQVDNRSLKFTPNFSFRVSF